MSLSDALSGNVLAQAEHWSRFLLEGVGFLVVAALLMYLPWAQVVDLESLLGLGLLLVGGLQGLRVWHAHRQRVRHFAAHLSALLLVVFGLMLLVFPQVVLETLALMVGLLFLLEGGLRLVEAWRLPGLLWSRWLLMLAGLVGVALGLLLATGYPTTDNWAIGLFVGLNLMVHGVTILVHGLVLRGVARRGTL